MLLSVKAKSKIKAWHIVWPLGSFRRNIKIPDLFLICQNIWTTFHEFLLCILDYFYLLLLLSCCIHSLIGKHSAFFFFFLNFSKTWLKMNLSKKFKMVIAMVSRQQIPNHSACTLCKVSS